MERNGKESPNIALVTSRPEANVGVIQRFVLSWVGKSSLDWIDVIFAGIPLFIGGILGMYVS
jgi:hypothetical protein